MDVVKLTKYLSCPSRVTLERALKSCSNRRIIAEFDYLVAKDLDQSYDTVKYSEIYKTRQTCLGVIKQWLDKPNGVSKQQLRNATVSAMNSGPIGKTSVEAAYAFDAAYSAAMVATIAATYIAADSIDEAAALDTNDAGYSAGYAAYAAAQTTSEEWTLVTRILITHLKKHKLIPELTEELWLS